MMSKAKILSAMAAALAVAIALAGCGGSGTHASLSGRITDSRGAALQGVTVAIVSPVAGQSAVTNASGQFSIGGVPAGQTVIVRCRKDGYVAETSYPIPVIRGHNSEFEAVLVRVGTSQVVDATVENVVTHARGDGIKASVRLPAGSIVDSAGMPVASAVVNVTAIPTDPNGTDTRPDVVVTRTPGQEEADPLVATPAVAVELRDAAGKELKLDPTKPATIEFPVVAASDPGDATVGLWSQQPLPATWVEEGVATRDNTVSPPIYRAQVTHFSQFVSGTRASYPYKLNLKVYENPTIPNPVPVAGAFVKVVDIGNAVVQVGTTDANGLAVFRMPGVNYYIKATKLGYMDKGVYSTTQNLNIVTVIYWLQNLATGGGGG